MVTAHHGGSYMHRPIRRAQYVPIQPTLSMQRIIAPAVTARQAGPTGHEPAGRDMIWRWIQNNQTADQPHFGRPVWQVFWRSQQQSHC